MVIQTALSPPNPTPSDDAQKLYSAFNGSECDISTVINILAHRDYTQRGLIKHEYRGIYGKDIMEDLASKLSDKFKKSVLLWMPKPAERDAKLIRDWVTNAASKQLTNAANEVICSQSASGIQSIKNIYDLEYGTILEEDISCRTSGDPYHQLILLSFVTTPRDEGHRVAADEDAKDLYEAGGRGMEPDWYKLICRIFSERSSAHLAHVASAYANMYETPLKKVIKTKTSGNFLQCLSIILQCAENPAAYFAEELHKSKKNDTALIRLIVSRAEIDLHDIKTEYQKKYNRSLQDAVEPGKKHNYKKFLLALLHCEFIEY